MNYVTLLFKKESFFEKKSSATELKKYYQNF